LDIDLDDPQLLQALDDCVQRGGGGALGGGGGGGACGGGGGVPRRNVAAVNNDNAVTPVTSTAERLQNIDFISMFFQNTDPPTVDSVRQNVPVLDNSDPENKNNVVVQRNVTTVTTAKSVHVHHPFVRRPKTTRGKIIDNSGFRSSALSETSSSPPSCYQTGTNASIPIAPANSPNDTSTSNNCSRYKINRLPIFKRRQLQLRRKRSNQSLRVKSNLRVVRRHGRPGTTHPLVDGGHCCGQRTVLGAVGSEFLGTRPPCQGQECSPVRRVVGVGKDRTPLGCRQIGVGKDRTPVRCRQTLPPQGVTPIISFCSNTKHRIDAAVVAAHKNATFNVSTPAVATISRYVPSSLGNTQEETEPSEGGRSSRSSIDPMALHPPQPVIDSATRKVSLWLSHLEPADSASSPYEVEDAAAISLRPQDSSTESSHSAHPVVPTVHRTINQILNTKRARVMTPGVCPDFRFPTSGCKRTKQDVSHRCNAVHRLSRPGQVCSLSSDMYPDEDDDAHSMDGNGYGKRVTGYGERAVFEFPKNVRQEADVISSSGFLADQSEATDARSPFPLCNRQSSEWEYELAVPPPSECSQFVSNSHDRRLEQNVTLPGFEVLRKPISAMLAINNKSHIFLIPEVPTTQSRCAAPVLEARPSVQRGPCANLQLNVANQIRLLHHHQRMVLNNSLNSDTSDFMRRPITGRQPVTRRAVCLADRRKLMLMRGLKVVGMKLRQKEETNNPLETLAIL